MGKKPQILSGVIASSLCTCSWGFPCALCMLSTPCLSQHPLKWGLFLGSKWNPFIVSCTLRHGHILLYQTAHLQVNTAFGVISGYCESACHRWTIIYSVAIRFVVMCVTHSSPFPGAWRTQFIQLSLNWMQRLSRRVSGTPPATLSLPQNPPAAPHTGHLHKQRMKGDPGRQLVDRSPGDSVGQQSPLQCVALQFYESSVSFLEHIRDYETKEWCTCLWSFQTYLSNMSEDDMVVRLHYVLNFLFLFSYYCSTRGTLWHLQGVYSIS
jgi:hypothetical protein